MKIAWNKGKKLSEEHRKKLSLAHMGMISSLKGKKRQDVAWNKGKIQWKNCKGCEKPIRKWKTYCTWECSLENRKKAVLFEKKCETCEKIFYVQSKNKDHLNCSDSCGAIAHGLAVQGINKRKWTTEEKKRMSAVKQHINESEWQGYKNTENRRDRLKFQRLIQRSVLKRDDYTCQLCGKRGGIFHVDHIQPFAEYIEGRFSMNNCRTLCRECHYFVTFHKPIPQDSKWGINFMKEVD